MGNNAILRELSLILYGMNGSYTHSTDYMVAMPTLDKVVVSYGKDKKKCKLGEELMTATLRRIKDKEIVRDALFRGIVEGAYYGYFETKKRRNSRKKFMSDFDVQSINEINDADYRMLIYIDTQHGNRFSEIILYTTDPDKTIMVFCGDFTTEGLTKVGELSDQQREKRRQSRK